MDAPFPTFLLFHCIDIAFFDVSNNLMVGSIPTELGLLTKMQYINLSRNRFTGIIPTELGQLDVLGKKFPDPYLCRVITFLIHLFGAFHQKTSFWRTTHFMEACHLQFVYYQRYIVWKNCMPTAYHLTMNEFFVTLRSHGFSAIAVRIAFET